MGQIIIFLGPTGSGKTTQADQLAERSGYQRISTGDLVRGSQDPEMQRILKEGGLAPSHKVNQLLEEALDQSDPGKTVVLDGFPRMVEEAEWLDENLSGLDRTISRVFLLEAAEPEIESRLLKRGRHDDQTEVIKKRWQLYQAETMPVVDYYDRQKMLTRIDAVGSVEAIAERIAAKL